ncbi:DNA-directed RNA polymerase sigma-70 factor [Bacteroidia bacterium]|nr:DNA-directed RNA polymerase sigma-70 factor [Bacteroidia bacterium]GHV38788.1 DNA-directed RNA polymerase sigma-70 factor [Bacteroidia bacterium]
MESHYRKMIQKEDESFSDIYKTYYPRLVRFSLAYLDSLDDAKNVVQDIFLHLLEHQDILHAVKNHNAYFFTSVKNQCINHLRRQIKLKELSLTELEYKEKEMKLYSLENFDDTLLSDEKLEIVLQKAIDTLPPRCREVFILCRFEGLSHKQVAARLNISTNTVENHMSSAIRRLSVGLKDYLPLFFFFF